MTTDAEKLAPIAALMPKWRALADEPDAPHDGRQALIGVVNRIERVLAEPEPDAHIRDALRLLDEAIAGGGRGIPWVNAIVIRNALTGNLHPAIRADLDA